MKGRKAVIIRYLAVIAVFLVFAGVLVAFFSSREPITYEPPVKPVEVAKPKLRMIPAYVETTGYVMAEAMIPVVPFVQGTIESYYASPGKTVEEGDVIAVIDKTPYELQLAQARAQATALDSALERMEQLISSLLKPIRRIPFKSAISEIHCEAECRPGKHSSPVPVSRCNSRKSLTA